MASTTEEDGGLLKTLGADAAVRSAVREYLDESPKVEKTLTAFQVAALAAVAYFGLKLLREL